MRPTLAAAFEHEMASAAQARAAGDLARAFAHYERAHVLGQRATWRHVRSHLGMFAVGWARRDAREIVGQSTRLLAATLFSRIWVPVGNTGGANVGAMRPMPIPDDLRALLGDDGR